MARGHNLRGSYPLTCVTGDSFVYALKFTSANASTPTSITQASDGATVAYSTTGTYTVTLPANARPAALLFGEAVVLGDEANIFAKVVSYVASTGVLTITQYTNTAGTIAAANNTGKVLQVFCVFSRKAANS